MMNPGKVQATSLLKEELKRAYEAAKKDAVEDSQ